MPIWHWSLSKRLLALGVFCLLLGMWLMAPTEANYASTSLNTRPRAKTTLRFVPTATGPYMIGISDGLGKGTYCVRQNGKLVAIHDTDDCPFFDAVAGKPYDVSFTMPQRVPLQECGLTIGMSYEVSEQLESATFMWRAPVVIFVVVAVVYGFVFWLEVRTRGPHHAKRGTKKNAAPWT